MNLGICCWAFDGAVRGRRSVVDLAEAAKRAGFSSLEGSYAPRGPFAPDLAPPASPPLPVASLATLELHRFHLTDPRPRHRARALETVDAMLLCAARWEIPSLSFSPGVLPAAGDVEQTLDELAHDLRPRVDRAIELGLDLALENLPGHVLAQRATLRALLDRLPGAGVCLDLGNALLDPPVEAWIEEFAPSLVKLHLTDGRVVDQDFVALEPGEGEVPWEAVRRTLDGLPPLPVFLEAMATGEDEAGRLEGLWRRASPLLADPR